MDLQTRLSVRRHLNVQKTKEKLIQTFTQSIDERVKAGEYDEECAAADLNSIEKMGILNKKDIKGIFSRDTQDLPPTGLVKKSSLKETFKIAINSKIARLGGKEVNDKKKGDAVSPLDALHGVEFEANQQTGRSSSGQLTLEVCDNNAKWAKKRAVARLSSVEGTTEGNNHEQSLQNNSFR